MEKIDQILESLYDRVIEPLEAKEQLLLLFGVSGSSSPDDFWKQEYDEAVKEISNLQDQLEDAESVIRDMESELRSQY